MLQYIASFQDPVCSQYESPPAEAVSALQSVSSDCILCGKRPPSKEDSYVHIYRAFVVYIIDFTFHFFFATSFIAVASPTMSSNSIASLPSATSDSPSSSLTSSRSSASSSVPSIMMQQHELVDNILQPTQTAAQATVYQADLGPAQRSNRGSPHSSLDHLSEGSTADSVAGRGPTDSGYFSDLEGEPGRR
jgi:hypothetical protein